MQQDVKQQIYMVYSTFPNQEEALSAARMLIEEKLAACVNLYPGMVSLYRWEGQVQQSQEVALVAKTTQGKLATLMDAIKTRHSYDLPCITAYKASEGFAPFLQWVRDECAN